MPTGHAPRIRWRQEVRNCNGPGSGSIASIEAESSVTITSELPSAGSCWARNNVCGPVPLLVPLRDVVQHEMSRRDGVCVGTAPDMAIISSTSGVPRTHPQVPMGTAFLVTVILRRLLRSGTVVDRRRLHRLPEETRVTPVPQRDAIPPGRERPWFLARIS